MQGKVKKLVGDVLEEHLPQAPAYPTDLFKAKQAAVYTHLFNVASRGRGYWA